MIDVQDINETLDRLERSGDRVVVAFDLEGRTVKVPGPYTPDEARSALGVALSLKATRFTLTRWED